MQSNLRCFKVLLADALCTRSRASAVNKQCPAVSWPDLTSRSFFREMTAEAKNALSVNRREECKAQKAPDQSGFVQPAGNLQPQTTGPPPANQELESALLQPIRSHTQDLSLWPLAFQPHGQLQSGQGGCWIPWDPYLPPRALKTAWLLCLIWSAEEQQVKRSTREHYLWSNKCRVALSLENILRALMIQTETLMPCIIRQHACNPIMHCDCVGYNHAYNSIFNIKFHALQVSSAICIGCCNLNKNI